MSFLYRNIETVLGEYSNNKRPRKKFEKCTNKSVDKAKNFEFNSFKGSCICVYFEISYLNV